MNYLQAELPLNEHTGSLGVAFGTPRYGGARLYGLVLWYRLDLPWFVLRAVCRCGIWPDGSCPRRVRA